MRYVYVNLPKVLPLLVIGVLLLGVGIVDLAVAPAQPFKVNDDVQSIQKITSVPLGSLGHYMGVPMSSGSSGKRVLKVPISSSVKEYKDSHKESHTVAIKDVAECDSPPEITVRAVPSEIVAGDDFLVYIYIKNTNPPSCSAEEYSYHLSLPEGWSYNTQSSSSIISVRPGLTGLIVAKVTPLPSVGEYVIPVSVVSSSSETESNVDVVITPSDMVRIDLTPDHVDANYGDIVEFEVHGYDEYENEVEVSNDDCEWSTTIGEMSSPGVLIANEFGEGNVSVECDGYEDVSTVNITGCIHVEPEVTVVAPDEVAIGDEFHVIVNITNNDIGDCECEEYFVNFTSEWSSPVITSVNVCQGETGSVDLTLTAPVTTGVYGYTVNVSNPYVSREVEASLVVVDYNDLLFTADSTTVFSGQKVRLTYALVDLEGNIITPDSVVFSVEHGSVEETDDGIFYIPPEYSTDDVVTLNVSYEGQNYVENVTMHVTKVDRIEVSPSEVTLTAGEAQEYDVVIYSDDGRVIPLQPHWFYLYHSDAGRFVSGVLTAENVGDYVVNVTLCASDLAPESSGLLRIPGDGDDSGLPHVEVCPGRKITGTAVVHVAPGTIESLRIEPSSADVGTTAVEFTAIGTNELGVDVEVSADWSVDDPSLVTLSDTAGSRINVSAVDEGLVVLTAEVDGMTATADLNVDGLAPRIEYVDPTPLDGDRVVAGTPITINVSVEDANEVDVIFVVDSEEHIVPAVGGSASYLALLDVGDHEISVYAVDSFGNRADLEERTITVVEDSPTEIVEEPVNDSLILAGSVVFNVSDSDGLDEISYSVDSDTPTVVSVGGDENYTLMVSLTDFGEHTIEINVTDELGVVTSFVYTYRVGSAPVITLVSPTDGRLMIIGEPVLFDVTDADGSIVGMPEYSFDNVTYYDFTDMVGGDYRLYAPSGTVGDTLNIYVRATDDDGFVTTEVFTFTYVEGGHVVFDPPCGSELLLGDELSISIDSEWTVNDVEWGYVEGVDYTADPWIVATNDYTGPITIDDTFPEGNITVYVMWKESHDSICDTQSATCVFNINYPPHVESISPGNESNVRWGDNITICVNDSDGIALDGRTYAKWDELVYTIPFDDNCVNITVDEALVAPGAHTLTVHITDLSDHALTTDVSYTFYRTDGPSISWDNIGDAIDTSDGKLVIVGDNLTFTVDSDTPLVNVSYKIDDELTELGAPSVPYTFNITVPENYGVHTLTVYAENDVGFSTTAEYTIVIERYPVITSVTPANGSSIVGVDNIQFDIDDNDDVVGYATWNDGATLVMECSAGVCNASTLGVHEDYNTLHVRICDADYESVGLCVEEDYVYTGELEAPWFEVTPENGTVFVEGVDAAEVNVTAHDNVGLAMLNYTCNSDPEVNVSLSGTEDNVTITCSWVEGENTLFIEVIDSDGQVVNATYVFYYDSTGPVIVLESPSEGSVIFSGDIINLTITDVSDFSVVYYWDDESPVTLSEPFDITVSDMTLGEHVLHVNATDANGFESSASFTFVFNSIPGNLTGIVREDDESGGMPIVNANVTLYDSDGNLVAWTLTNSSGGYRFDNIQPGVYTVRANATGYLPGGVAGIVVTSGSETVADDIELTKYGTVHVTVYDSSLPPVRVGSGVTVELIDSMGNVVATGTTDVLSEYTFENVVPGGYTVNASYGSMSGTYGVFPVHPGETVDVMVTIS